MRRENGLRRIGTLPDPVEFAQAMAQLAHAAAVGHIGIANRGGVISRMVIKQSGKRKPIRYVESRAPEI